MLLFEVCSVNDAVDCAHWQVQVSTQADHHCHRQSEVSAGGPRPRPRPLLALSHCAWCHLFRGWLCDNNTLFMLLCYCLQDPAAIPEAQLLKWQGSWDGSSSSSVMRSGLPAAAAAGSSSAVFARSIAGYRGSTAAAAAAISPDSLASFIGTADVSGLGLGLRSLAAGGVLGGGLPGSRHLAEVAPLSGLQPPAPRSRVVQDTRCTAGELLYLK
jgi:hypothetical protein